MNRSRKLNRLEKTLFALPLVILAWPLFVYLSQDKLDTEMRALAGPNAIDCGHWQGGSRDYAPRVQMNTQAALAFKAKRTFYYRDDESDPSAQSVGLVGTSDGKVYQLWLRKKAWYLPPVVEKWLWQKPFIVNLKNGSSILKCKGAIHLKATA